MVKSYVRVLKETPVSGFCVDRLDWSGRFNERRDDGISWASGKPAAFGLLGWRKAMALNDEAIHPLGAFQFVNDHLFRLDTMEYADGIYDEFGDYDFHQVGSSYLGLAKPIISWDHKGPMGGISWDLFLQRHLYTGSYPTVPFPKNDHCILPNDEYNKYFSDYGRLFSMMKGKEWVLTPHAISSVSGGSSSANLFKVKTGYALVIVAGGSLKSTTVTLKSKDLIGSEFTAYHPGNQPGVIIKPIVSSGYVIKLTVPLLRGCAVVHVSA